MKRYLPKGFTLIELLVTITIIAILGVIGVAVFTGAQRNARDGTRRANIESLAKSIESAKDPANTTPGAYSYTAALFATDYPGGLKDTSGYVYCLVNSSGTADPSATWTTTCPTGYSTLIDASGVYTTAVSGTSGWKICAPLEGGTAVCKKSLR